MVFHRADGTSLKLHGNADHFKTATYKSIGGSQLRMSIGVHISWCHSGILLLHFDRICGVERKIMKFFKTNDDVVRELNFQAHRLRLFSLGMK